MCFDVFVFAEHECNIFASSGGKVFFASAVDFLAKIQTAMRLFQLSRIINKRKCFNVEQTVSVKTIGINFGGLSNGREGD